MGCETAETPDPGPHPQPRSGVVKQCKQASSFDSYGRSPTPIGRL
jgi:hypothetical protein